MPQKWTNKKERTEGSNFCRTGSNTKGVCQLNLFKTHVQKGAPTNTIE